MTHVTTWFSFLPESFPPSVPRCCSKTMVLPWLWRHWENVPSTRVPTFPGEPPFCASDSCSLLGLPLWTRGGGWGVVSAKPLGLSSGAGSGSLPPGTPGQGQPTCGTRWSSCTSRCSTWPCWRAGSLPPSPGFSVGLQRELGVGGQKRRLSLPQGPLGLTSGGQPARPCSGVRWGEGKCSHGAGTPPPPYPTPNSLWGWSLNPPHPRS